MAAGIVFSLLSAIVIDIGSVARNHAVSAFRKFAAHCSGYLIRTHVSISTSPRMEVGGDRIDTADRVMIGLKRYPSPKLIRLATSWLPAALTTARDY
jgi:hypothetical protein